MSKPELVVRLRMRVDSAEANSRFGDAEDMRDAADEIERLQETAVAADRAIKHSHADADRLRSELADWQRIARQGIDIEVKLRAELEPLRAELAASRVEVETWKDRYEAAEQAHQATIKDYRGATSYDSGPTSYDNEIGRRR